MHFVVFRMSDKEAKQAPPLPNAQPAGQTLFGDPVFVVQANTIEELLNLCQRSRTSAPGDIGLVLWRKAPQAMSLPPELENLPAIEIFDQIRDY